jgi:hypothetical protein
MVQPVNSTQSYDAAQATSTRVATTPQKPAANPPQDTVALSSAARGGDVDHDGDSH